MSDEVREQLLDQHNQLRRKIAKGLQADQPPAADMREMVGMHKHQSSGL